MSGIPSATQSKVVRPIRKTFYASRSDMIRLGRRIGTGAEGEVYEIQNRSDLVAKIYHQPPPPEKAEKLVVLASLGNERLFNLSAWPVSTLRDAPDGEIVGFVMRKISDAEEVHALHSPKSRLQKFPEASWAFLIYAAANIARAVMAIHEHGLVIGDVNPKNILVTRKATVYLLDVDSFQVSVDGKTYRCEGGFPEYTPPELQGVAFRKIDRRQEHDRFGLAVVIFQLLFLGRHPYSGMYLGAGEMPLERAIRESRFAYGVDAEARKMRQPPGALALDSMPPAMVELFRRAFLSEDRPHPREWIEELDALSKALKKCDLHSGHYYYQELRACPWCGIEKQARVRLFNFLVHVDDSRRGPFRLDEIWKEIVRVNAPAFSLIRLEEELKALEPSPEVMAFAKHRRSHFIMALLVASFAGAAIAFIPNILAGFLLLILTGVVACSIGITWRTSTVPDDNVLLEEIQTRLQKAREEARQLQLQFDREAGNERWRIKRDELRKRKETYENLAEIRRRRLAQLESEARDSQLVEFLDQFKINDAKLKGISSNLKTVLISHGIETAADLLQDVTKIPSIGRARAKWLNEWRRGLESKFVFDPARSVNQEARIKVEREIDALRHRLESELTNGAHYLRYIKLEIETNREKLQPVLTQAKRELAQAEMDMKVARKRSSAWLILVALIIAFCIGFTARLQLFEGGSAASSQTNSGSQSPGVAGSDLEPATAGKLSSLTATRFYENGKWLVEQQSFEAAANAFQMTIDVDPNFSSAYEGLSDALLRMKKYEESAEASNKAISLSPAFKPYYNLGLAHFAMGNWQEAILAFQKCIENRDARSWNDEYTQAYYFLGLSLAKTSELRMEIAELEASPGFLEIPINRFKLGVFYLCGGWVENAEEQRQLLEKNHARLAKELDKLMNKHGEPN